MPETIILVLIVARIKKYDIKALFKLKELYLILLFECIYILMQSTFFAGNYTFLPYTSLLKSMYICSYLGLIIRNQLFKEAIIGSGFIILGGMLNDLAIAANGGKMPVFPSISYLTGYVKADTFVVAQTVANDFHILGTPETNFKILTDIIDLGYSILSIGDILIRVFMFLILYQSIKKVSHTSQRI